MDWNISRLVVCSLIGIVGSAKIALAGNSSIPVGEPVLEQPTLRSLGAYWMIRGDDNQNARIEFSYRKNGTASWQQGPPLFRVERRTTPYLGEGGETKETEIQVPPDCWLFAGSILLLDPNTAYDLKLKLTDHDGGGTERLLHSHTIAEPEAPANAPVRHVIPGNGGGTGSASDPFKGLHTAAKAARPGEIFVLHSGTYAGIFTAEHSGEPGKPIIWRGAGDGEAIIDAQFPLDKLSGAAIEAGNLHDVWFEKLSVRNAYNLIRAHESARIVVRRCHFSHCICGVVAVDNKTKRVADFFISDNVFDGDMPWPVTDQQWHDLPEARAIWLSGRGHVVCYNRIHHFKDGMDTDDGPVCAAIDFHNNDISEMFDDGCEMDGSERNTRNFCNRYCNTLTGVSLQPVYGGPVYVYRNVIFNCRTEAFKLHNGPSGGLMIHNTIVKSGGGLQVMTEDKVIHCISRNNLVLGTSGRAIDMESPMIDCDFNYDGFGGVSGPVFLKWNNVRYPTLQDVRAKSPVEKHCVIVDPATALASGVLPPTDPNTVCDPNQADVRLKAGSAAIDAGEVLPGFNNDYKGKAPDLGAYELGAELVHYGPRDEK